MVTKTTVPALGGQTFVQPAAAVLAHVQAMFAQGPNTELSYENAYAVAQGQYQRERIAGIGRNKAPTVSQSPGIGD